MSEVAKALHAAAARRAVKITSAHLERLISVIDTKLAEIAPIDNRDYEAWKARQGEYRAILDHLVKTEGARYRPGATNGYGMSLATIKVSCISGPYGLLTNWQNAARRKIAADAGKGRCVMAYFSNGTEGMDYEERYCARCIHEDGCPIWSAHMLYNYEHCNKPESILHMLIPRESGGIGNAACRLFIEKAAIGDLFAEGGAA